MLIAIGVYAAPGTSTVSTPLAEKMDILRQVYEACRHEGQPVAFFATGDPEAVRAVLPGIPLHGVYGVSGRQHGETAIVAKMALEAKRMRLPWVMKIAGDCFFTRPGWAAAWLAGVLEHKALLAACKHHRPDWITTQCFLANTDFLLATWPPADSDFNRIGVEAHWGEAVAKAAPAGAWWRVPHKMHAADGCSNCVPADAAMTYEHAHSKASAAGWKVTVPTIEPDKSLKISIIMPARNEDQKDRQGNYLLEKTIQSIEATSEGFEAPEIIIVDDGSTRPLPLAKYRGNLRVIRNPLSLGVDPSRNIGLHAATGDVSGVIDAHQYIQDQQGVPDPGAIQRAATVAMQREALVVANCVHLELTPAPGPVLTGASFVPLNDPKTQLAIGWNMYTPHEGIRPVNAILGACYFASNPMWARLQYFVNDCRCWGYSEEGLSLKAHFMGVPILHYGGAFFSHWFRPTGPHPYAVDGWHKILNRAKVLKVTFGEKAYKEVWEPRIKGHPTWQPKWEELLGAHSLLCEAARFQAVKTVSDEQVLKEVFQYG